MVSNLIDLENRLRFFGINGRTKRAINVFLPVMLPQMDAIADRFYGYMLNFPEVQAILKPHYKNGSLKKRQVDHWIKLFSCRLDEEFYAYSLNIGKIHYAHKVSPHLYIGSYAYIQADLLQLASTHFPDPDMRAAVLAAISRLIALDMDLALSAYTREHWLQSGPKVAGAVQPSASGEIFFVC